MHESATADVDADMGGLLTAKAEEQEIARFELGQGDRLRDAFEAGRRMR